MKRNLLKLTAAVCALAVAGSFAACGSDSKDPEWEWPSPDDPDEPAAEKPRFIWVDAAANFPDFADSQENIRRDLTRAREVGFTDIVVDVLAHYAMYSSPRRTANRSSGSGRGSRDRAI